MLGIVIVAILIIVITSVFIIIVKSKTTKNNNLQNLFEEKREKHFETCQSCGAKIEIDSKFGKCPYCNAKIIKK